MAKFNLGEIVAKFNLDVGDIKKKANDAKNQLASFAKGVKRATLEAGAAAVPITGSIQKTLEAEQKAHRARLKIIARARIARKEAAKEYEESAAKIRAAIKRVREATGQTQPQKAFKALQKEIKAHQEIINKLGIIARIRKRLALKAQIETIKPRKRVRGDKTLGQDPIVDPVGGVKAAATAAKSGLSALHKSMKERLAAMAAERKRLKGLANDYARTLQRLNEAAGKRVGGNAAQRRKRLRGIQKEINRLKDLANNLGIIRTLRSKFDLGRAAARVRPKEREKLDFGGQTNLAKIKDAWGRGREAARKYGQSVKIAMATVRDSVAERSNAAKKSIGESWSRGKSAAKEYGESVKVAMRSSAKAAKEATKAAAASFEAQKKAARNQQTRTPGGQFGPKVKVGFARGMGRLFAQKFSEGVKESKQKDVLGTIFSGSSAAKTGKGLGTKVAKGLKIGLSALKNEVDLLGVHKRLKDSIKGVTLALAPLRESLRGVFSGFLNGVRSARVNLRIIGRRIRGIASGPVRVLTTGLNALGYVALTAFGRLGNAVGAVAAPIARLTSAINARLSPAFSRLGQRIAGLNWTRARRRMLQFRLRAQKLTGAIFRATYSLVGFSARLSLLAAKALPKVYRGITKLALGIRKLSTTLFSLRTIATAAGAVLGAFGLSQVAANVSNMSVAFSSLARSLGSSPVAALGKLRKALKNTVDDLEIARSTSRAVIFNIADSVDDLASFFNVARRLGRATGRSTAQAIEDITLGIGRQSRLILDNIGLIVRVRIANEQYAAVLRKSSEDLTDLEKREAFRRAALSAANVAVTRLGRDTTTFADIFYQAQTAVKNFVNSLAATLTPALRSLTETFRDFLGLEVSDQSLVKSIARPLAVLLFGVKKLILENGDQLKSLSSGISDGLVKGVAVAGLTVRSVMARIGKVFSADDGGVALGKWLGDVVGFAATLITSVFKEILNQAILTINDLFNAASKARKNPRAGGVSPWEHLIEQADQPISKFILTVSREILSVGLDVIESLMVAFSRALSHLDFGWFGGGKVFEDLPNAMMKAFSGVKEAVGFDPLSGINSKEKRDIRIKSITAELDAEIKKLEAEKKRLALHKAINKSMSENIPLSKEQSDLLAEDRVNLENILRQRAHEKNLKLETAPTERLLDLDLHGFTEASLARLEKFIADFFSLDPIGDAIAHSLDSFDIIAKEGSLDVDESKLKKLLMGIAEKGDQLEQFESMDLPSAMTVSAQNFLDVQDAWLRLMGIDRPTMKAAINDAQDSASLLVASFRTTLREESRVAFSDDPLAEFLTPSDLRKIPRPTESIRPEVATSAIVSTTDIEGVITKTNVLIDEFATVNDFIRKGAESITLMTDGANRLMSSLQVDMDDEGALRGIVKEASDIADRFNTSTIAVERFQEILKGGEDVSKNVELIHEVGKILGKEFRETKGNENLLGDLFGTDPDKKLAAMSKALEELQRRSGLSTAEIAKFTTEVDGQEAVMRKLLIQIKTLTRAKGELEVAEQREQKLRVAFKASLSSLTNKYMGASRGVVALSAKIRDFNKAQELGLSLSEDTRAGRLAGARAEAEAVFDQTPLPGFLRGMFVETLVNLERLKIAYKDIVDLASLTAKAVADRDASLAEITRIRLGLTSKELELSSQLLANQQKIKATVGEGKEGSEEAIGALKRLNAATRMTHALKLVKEATGLARTQTNSLEVSNLKLDESFRSLTDDAQARALALLDIEHKFRDMIQTAESSIKEALKAGDQEALTKLLELLKELETLKALEIELFDKAKLEKDLEDLEAIFTNVFESIGNAAIAAARSGSNRLKDVLLAAAQSLTSLMQPAMEKMAETATMGVRKTIEAVFKKIGLEALTLYNDIIGVIIGLIAASFVKDNVDISEIEESGIDASSQAVRGVIAGPQSIAIAEIGSSIAEANSGVESLLSDILNVLEEIEGNNLTSGGLGSAGTI